MDWWTEVRLATGTFLAQHGLLAAFVFLLIEEAGVPVPVPGDFLMLVLGVQARFGQVALWEAIVVMELATVLGATFLYVAARLTGRGLVYRYGRFVRLTPERLDRAEHWLTRHGTLAVFLGRLVPGLRILTAVACGVFNVPVRVYLPAMSFGALFYISIYTLLGYLIGPPILDFVERLHLPFGLLGSLIPLGVIVVWTIRGRQALRRRPLASEFEHDRQLRAGAAAGLLATVGSTLFINVVLNLAGNLAFHAPGTIVQQTAARLAFALAREAHPGLLFVALAALLTVGVLWGAVYGLWVEEWLPTLPDWAKGLLFSLVPLTVSMLVVMPILGLGLFGVGATGAVALVGEMIRHAAYGALLGLIYPVLLTRRTVRVMPHTPAEVAPASL
jgi:membrane-associated protein